MKRKVYYNFKVAQNSADYHEWVSDINNGWDLLPSGTRFAIIRRNR